MRILLTLSILFVTTMSIAEVKVGAAAPAFSEIDQNGKSHKLEDYKGSWLVLEWYNEDCPYVKKHYGSKNMQNLQKKYAGLNVKWLTVATSPKGKQGYVDPKTAVKHFKEAGMNSTALLLDSDGSMGRAYNAKTTPHMFIINPEGQVVYAGAIDSNDSSNPKTIKTAENYVVAALDAGMSGKQIAKTSATPYGCSVKY